MKKKNGEQVVQHFMSNFSNFFEMPRTLQIEARMEKLGQYCKCCFEFVTMLRVLVCIGYYGKSVQCNIADSSVDCNIFESSAGRSVAFWYAYNGEVLHSTISMRASPSWMNVIVTAPRHFTDM